MNKKWLLLLVGAGVGYWLLTQWRRGTGQRVAAGVAVPGGKIPPGGRLTGRIETTTNNRPPGYSQEAVGYGIRQWAEIQLQDGSKAWAELEPK